MVVRCKVITALNQRFTHLKTILADQGFDGVDFLTTVKANYQLTIEVVYGVPGVNGFHPNGGLLNERLGGGPYDQKNP